MNPIAMTHTLSDVLLRLEHLLAQVSGPEPVADPVVSSWNEDWQEAVAELTHRLETEHPDEATLAACRQRLTVILARLPVAQAFLKTQLSETARQLYQENERNTLLEKGHVRPTGRVIYRKI